MAKSKGTVLIVDDEPEIREIIALGTVALGYDVLEASDGGQAIEVVRGNAVDVIVSDLMMPKVTGITLLQNLRDAGYMQPFIIVTAYPSQDSTLHALRLGAFDYLEKPFERSELQALLTEAMRVSRGVDAAVKPQKEAGIAAEIMKLRSLRFTSDANTDEEALEAREKMVRLFVAEATPQLIFCSAAIQALAREEERAHELGYLFRVMQALQSAATTLAATEFARLAGAAELFYTSLRIRPRVVTSEHIELATRANAAIQDAVTRVDQLPKGAHEDLVAELRQAAELLDNGLSQAG
jgi:DNA-binding response OmpR family regulator